MILVSLTVGSVPAGIFNMLVLQLSMPTNFPRHLHPASKVPFYSRTTFRRLDLVGCFLLFGASALLVACLQEAGLRYRWSSALIIILLVLCGLMWHSFGLFEWFITRKQETALGPEACALIFHESLQDAVLPEELSAVQSKKTGMEPVFPWRFARNRVFLSMLL
jgi:hypothetical protein